MPRQIRETARDLLHPRMYKIWLVFLISGLAAAGWPIGEEIGGKSWGKPGFFIALGIGMTISLFILSYEHYSQNKEFNSNLDPRNNSSPLLPSPTSGGRESKFLST